MFLRRLSLFNFKNYGQADFEFCDKINCLVGGNGVGKTNVLDAIHYLSLCKSCINPSDTQNIRYQTEGFVVQGEYLRDNQQEVVSCGVKVHQKKTFKRNAKEYERLADHVGLFPLVMVSPLDSGLIIDGSEQRRRFMNEVISQYDHAYLYAVMQYNRVLMQRNALLKQFAETNLAEPLVLDVLDDQLASWGQAVFEARTAFCEALVPLFQTFYRYISDEQESVTLTYKSPLQQETFPQLLQRHFEKDRFLAYTSTGVHRDDLLLEMNGQPIRRSASQGQQKTFLVALKLANYEFIRRNGTVKPILLLDDVFDKFDARRVKRIMELVAAEDFGQVFITDTDEDRIRNIVGGLTCPVELKILTAGVSEG